MPDWNFYNLLINKFQGEFPPEFWRWLQRQDIRRPWWTNIMGDATLRNYLQQQLQAFSQSQVAPAAKQWAPAVPVGGAQVNLPQPAPPKEPETTTPQMPQVVSQGGYDWQAVYTLDGKFSHWEVIGKTVETGLTPWQEWQKGQTLWERELQERQLRQQESQARETATAGALGVVPAGISQAQRADEWERMRQDILGQITPEPRNWITQWRAQNLSNPFTKGLNPEEQLSAGLEARENAKAIYQTALEIEKSAASDPNRALSESEKGMIQSAKDNYARVSREVLATQIERQKGAERARTGAPAPGYQGTQEWAGYWATAMAEGLPGAEEFGAFQQGKAPTMPEIPLWLQGVSGLKGRVPEKRVEVQRPSAQLWETLLPEQKWMYAGLLDWAGKETFQSTKAQMEKEIPQEPTLGRTWKPSRQWR